jgi:hypothetical protein
VIVDKLAREVIAASRDPAVVSQLTKLGIEPTAPRQRNSRRKSFREQPQFDLAIKAANLRER